MKKTWIHGVGNHGEPGAVHKKPGSERRRREREGDVLLSVILLFYPQIAGNTRGEIAVTLS